MFSGLLNKLKSAGLNWLGLGKNKSQSGLINKAKDFVGGLNSFITSKGVKDTVNSVGSFIPQIKDYYNTSKKYINMADQFVNQQGLSKKFDRVVKKPPHLWKE